MTSEKKLNLPNVLSAYRILALPFIVWTIAAGEKQAYITLLSVNLVTDILDGLIARRFGLETEFGARLDSIADIGTYSMAFAGMIVLEQAFVEAHAVEFFVLIGLYASVQAIALLRFRRPTSFHLYSSKITGYVQGIFIFAYFVFGYRPWSFYAMLAVSCLAYTEALIIVLCIPQLRSNVKGIWFVVRQNGNIS